MTADVLIKTVEGWWKHSPQFTCRFDGSFILRDRGLTCDVGVFDTMYEAKLHAYKLTHPDEPTSFDIRKFLLADEIRLQRLLGQGDLRASDRHVLGMCLTVVMRAIKAEVWLL